jgi:CMP-N,N'-diacetyllegionaminic acid synthase
MINGKSVIAIIPARSGSKGLPGKNTKLLCGKPLVAWSIEAGLESQYIDVVVVSTDSQEIANIARDFGASIPFIRPSDLATDTATSFNVVKHALEFYKSEISRSFYYTVLLEPTSPLREKTDIDSMLEELEASHEDYDAIISLGEAHEHPSIMKRIRAGQIEGFSTELPATNRRQDNVTAYFPYGVGYISKTQTLMSEETFYPLRTTYHLIKRHQCFEIDDIYDFIAIEAVMNYSGLTK